LLHIFLARQSGRSVSKAWALAGLAFLSLLAVPSQANTSVFTYSGYSISSCAANHYCLQAGDFGVLVGLGTTATPTLGTVTSASASFSSADSEIGFGAGSTINFTGTASKAWGGPIDFADPLVGTPSTNCIGNACALPTGNNLANGSKKITVTGGTAQNAAWVNAGIEQVEAISDYWASWSGPVTTRTTIGSTIGVAGAGVQVFNITTATSTGAFTIHGGVNDLIVINLQANGINTFTGNITLDAALSVDQVLFNVTGTASGDILWLKTGNLKGAFIVRNDSYTASTALNGRLLGGSGALSWGANFNETAPLDTLTPEPATWLLMIGGIGAFAVHKRRRCRELTKPVF
jgi:hypothetical protein